MVLRNSHDVLRFSATTGALLSLRARSAPAQEFISSPAEPLAFAVNYLDDHRESRLLLSSQAQTVKVTCRRTSRNQRLTAQYRRIAGRNLHVRFTVAASRQDRFTRWNISVDNRCGLEITGVQFPFVVCPYHLGGAPGGETIVLPHGYGSGRVIRDPGAPPDVGQHARLPVDYGRLWDIVKGTDHYPGTQYAQFMAYHNERAGLYIACDDTQGHLKRFKPVHREPGLRLGIAHVGDWPARGRRTLEYDVLLGSFSGDWYDAAEIYRDWSLRQSWGTPLHRRTDVPAWLLDSPVYVTIRPQGELDMGPATPKREFLPYEKCIPLLAKVAAKVQAPLTAVLMGWERHGSWVYPDSLPPVGGEESLARFVKLARQRGWHVGAFCNGTRWATAHYWSGYDGLDYFYANGGPDSVCRDARGEPTQEGWDESWRPSYLCCLGSPVTRREAVGLVRRMIGWGFESLQFFDQNNGATTFPCYGRKHEHPPLPGRWMPRKMRDVIDLFHREADAAGEREVIHSAESGLNEFCLPLFQETELRIFPPTTYPDSIPLYQFLFHECVVLQGMMGFGPEPYHLQVRNAANCVWGGIPGGVLTGDGSLLNRDTSNWAPWTPKVGNDDAFEMIRTVTALRRGPGRDFLVFGRMQRPAVLTGVRTMHWTHGGRTHSLPAIFDAAWKAPDGRLGIVLANWTKNRTTCTVEHQALAKAGAVFHTSGRTMDRRVLVGRGKRRSVSLPPLSCAIIEATNAESCASGTIPGQ